MGFLEIGGISIFVAFAAGLLSCLSPCVLPLIPAYLGYLSGAAVEGATGVQSSGTSGGAVAMAVPRRNGGTTPFFHAVSFALGFTTVFVLFGVSLGLIGYALRDNQDIVLKVAGGVLIILGLHLSGVITIPWLEQERRLDAGGGQKVGYARSFLVGSAFSAGWSPCIGPTLGAIFALAVSSGTALQAGLLLLAYSAGLSIPFLALGLAYNGVSPLYNRLKRFSGIVSYVSGALLIIVGILIFTNSLINLNSAFNFGFLPDTSA